MKLFKRTFCVLLSVCIFFCAITLSAAAYSKQRFGEKILSQMDNSAALIFVYDKLVNGVKNSDSNISISHGTHKVTWDEVSTVYRIFYNDYPEYFWINGSCTGNVNSTTGVVSSITPTYTMSGSALQSAKNAFNLKVNSLLKGLDGKSDYEKSLVLHDRLAAAVDYVFSNNDQNAYGALVEGKAVCAGYTRAYQHLMCEAGLDSWYVSGTSINPTTNQNEGHAWNLVQVNGNWYYTDVTWDDQGDNIFHAYFNITTKQIKEGHTVDEFAEYLPNATATADNYFIKNNLVFSKWDARRLASLLKSNQDNTVNIYISGSVSTFKNTINSQIENVVEQMGVPALVGYRYSCSVLGREILLKVEFNESTHTHNPTAVPAKAPTCTSNGNKKYYACYCGAWFYTNTGTSEITDKSSMILSPIAHTPAEDYKHDDNNHWKICSVCKNIISETSGKHSDKNNNNGCDICGAKIKPVSSEPHTSDAGSNDTDSNNSNDISQPDDQKSAQIMPYVDFDKVGQFTNYLIYFGGAIIVIVISVVVILVLKRKRKK